MIDNLTEKLEGLQETWDKAPVGNVVPDDEYQATVFDIDFFESKDHANLYLKLVFQISFGDHAGQTVDWIGSLDHPERVSFTKEVLYTLGLDVENLAMSELISDLANKVGGAPCRISVVSSTKNGRTYQNVYVRERLGESLSDQSMSDTPADMADLPEAEQMPEGEPTKEEIGF